MIIGRPPPIGRVNHGRHERARKGEWGEEREMRENAWQRAVGGGQWAVGSGQWAVGRNFLRRSRSFTRCSLLVTHHFLPAGIAEVPTIFFAKWGLVFGAQSSSGFSCGRESDERVLGSSGLITLVIVLFANLLSTGAPRPGLGQVEIGAKTK
jgi:hypothetical protein